MGWLPLVPMTVIALLALAISYVLFEVLESNAILQTRTARVGGAAAAFFLLFWGLRSWYNQLEDRRTQSLELASMIARLAATNMVKEAQLRQGDLEAQEGLLYSEAIGSLKGMFRKQGQKWLVELEKEFDEEVRLQGGLVPSVRGLLPPKKPVEWVRSLPAEETQDQEPT